MKPVKKLLTRLSAFAIALLQVAPSWARGAGTTAGLTLLEAPSARAYGLAESMSSVSNDVAAFAYNPASLGSLRTGQASFLYQKGLIDDSYGHLIIGRPSAHGGLGLSVGYYDGGSMELYDGTGKMRTVTAQRDMTVSLGFAGRGGPWGWGFTGKYLSSELVEKERASGYAADFGLRFAATPRLQFGASVQNLGPKLTYVSEGDDLPRTARLGASMSFPKRSVTTTLLFDGAYRMIEEDFQPSVGLEVSLGGMALRTGFRQTDGAPEITAGAGFFLGGSSIDYSVGVAQAVDTTHRISYSFRFGSSAQTTPLFVRAASPTHPPLVARHPPTVQPAKPARTPVAKPAPRGGATVSVPSRPVYRVDHVRSVRRQPRTYTVRSGDTLASIAKAHYGDYRLWQRIYGANKHLLSDPRNVEVGQKIVLP